MIIKLIKVISVGLGLYVGVFSLWVFMMLACLQSGYECGGDVLTLAVREMYGPILRLFS